MVYAISSFVVVAIFISATIADCSRNDVYFKKVENIRLKTTKENVIRSEKVKFSEQCFGSCRGNAKCKSFNAKRMDGSINCTFLQVTRSSLPIKEAKILKDPNVSYFELQSCFRSSIYIDNTDAKDCLQLHQRGYREDGIYGIKVSGALTNAFCDMSLYGGGWTLIQKRDAKFNVDFNRNWESYRLGFGDLNSEFWLGNRNIHQLTKLNKNQVLFVLKRFTVDKKYYALYNTFNVGNIDKQFPLVIGSYKPNQFGNQNVHKDSMSHHNGKLFSTFDQDNDDSTRHCATDKNGGNWFADCQRVNLNGKHRATDWTGVMWLSIVSDVTCEALETTRIYIRRIVTLN